MKNLTWALFFALDALASGGARPADPPVIELPASSNGVPVVEDFLNINKESRHTRVLSQSALKYVPTDQAERAKWEGLEQVWIQADDYRVDIQGNQHFGTRLFARFRTQSIEQLQDYAFVNYIRGCQFHQLDDPLEGRFWLRDIVREFFDDPGFLFHHPKWVIDSYDSDPLYNSLPDTPNRHFAHRWTQVKDRYSWKNKRFFEEGQSIDHPELYVTDHPGQAYVSRDENGAVVSKGLSQDFRTCLFKAADIPDKGVLPNELGLKGAEPIVCFDWNAHWTYDEKTQQIERRQEMHPFCGDSPDVMGEEVVKVGD